MIICVHLGTVVHTLAVSLLYNGICLVIGASAVSLNKNGANGKFVYYKSIRTKGMQCH